MKTASLGVFWTLATVVGGVGVGGQTQWSVCGQKTDGHHSRLPPLLIHVVGSHGYR